MKSRIKSVLLGATIVIGGAWFVGSGMATAVGLDVWSVPELNARFEETERRTIDLEAIRQQAVGRTTHKEELIDGMLAGQLSLGEVVDEFEQMLAELPPGQNRLQYDYPEATLRELAYRNVYMYVTMRSEPYGEAVLATREQIELELHRFEGGGSLTPIVSAIR